MHLQCLNCCLYMYLFVELMKEMGENKDRSNLKLAGDEKIGAGAQGINIGGGVDGLAGAGLLWGLEEG